MAQHPGGDQAHRRPRPGADRLIDEGTLPAHQAGRDLRLLASDVDQLVPRWDQGYEHDLGLPPEGHHEPTTVSGRQYWTRIAAVRSEIEAHYRRRGAGPG